MRVGDGSTISTWSDLWLSDKTNGFISTSVHLGLSMVKVSHYLSLIKNNGIRILSRIYSLSMIVK